jgi:hypothetical protein
MPASHTALERALAVHGLRLRGGWIPAPGDVLPELPAGAAAAVVWMVGQVGSACWANGLEKSLAPGLHNDGAVPA